ncbi:YhdH/YhfP family quinone oxidoreductase [Chitinophaga sancti]|uniref:Alcohol dehydrogenase n=1 Tax=Chitinophaga sancti TaxID=1004 RepID=A0A1K1SVS0_9BACT|nr:YhdH/YhfP family quinone oxidoreductase [Chitinophaga sancti]WQD61083.1 YhdH/YhfP family quinone oxidoreductase [Chitinophaga sancti]WQG86788.1 YhdH/YhfP family quinone oxidoreductase [Chitinophaga sancti]SFW88433.1 alcohol dehydrogenase [Chitinophaga sancti]
MTEPFKAVQVIEADGKFVLSIVDKLIDNLPPGDVIIKVHYSSLNYKDALSATGNKGVTRQYPHTPGIDAAGEVVSSTDDNWKPGDQVIVTGFDFGMNTSGGFQEYIRVPAKWLVRLPQGLSLRESMIYGTAGFTAALSVQALLKTGVQPADGKIVVTGASGGVGSIAVAILSKLGYQVTAVSSKQAEFLQSLGAVEVLPRAEMDDASGRVMLKPRFAGGIDTVGGNVLATVVKSLQYGAAVTACGMVNGGPLPLTVFPFILKGIQLLGIDSVEYPLGKRAAVWEAMATTWKPAQLTQLANEIPLEKLGESINQILAGKVQGRTLVRLA